MVDTLVIAHIYKTKQAKCLRLFWNIRTIIKDHRTPNLLTLAEGSYRGMTKQTITINGRTYDAVTGLPIEQPEPAHNRAAPKHEQPKARAFTDIGPIMNRILTPHEVHAAAQAMHVTTQKSQTLYRKALKKPTTEPVLAKPHERSPMISRFNTTTQEPAKNIEPAKPADEPIQPAIIHPTVAKVLQAQTPTPQKQLSGTDLKEQLIKERLAEVSTAPTKKQKKANWLSRQPRLVTILSSTLALLVLGGYLTYITLPSISLRVAASRAGVNASMPEYKPDGYSLDGPITYSPGEVVVSYKSNTNDSGYKLTQKSSNWDSQAVLDNYVGKQTDNYLTFQERGITVYTFNNKAAWVNGGILYTIDGNASLSSDQVLRIATSL